MKIPYSKITFSFLLTIFLSACIPVTPIALVPLPTSTETNPAESVPVAEWITVYFSDPDNPSANIYRGGADDELVAAIDAARFSVDAALYDLNLWSIRDALVAAHERGVSVRLVTESDYLDEDEIQDVLEAGIPTIDDQRESLMHNKFIIIDNYEIWTGSMNMTVNGAYKNNNNLLRIASPRLAENYLAEFEEMFSNKLFGDHIAAHTPHPSLEINGTRIETYFSPDDHTANRIIELIQNAQESIYFMAFSFTSDPIADAMIARANAGIDVAGVMETRQYHSNTGGEFDTLAEAGIDVHLDGNPNNLHHKVIIIDRKIVITGSYNFSRSAEERNDENTLIIHNAEIAAQYLAEFERVLAQATGN
ncbi:MAG: phospholipase [Anaerolineae bacterium]|nr:phospholipase [Anaerolineae bacterium]MBL6965945.1 phospholipase [Anaerolineales bacterium]